MSSGSAHPVQRFKPSRDCPASIAFGVYLQGGGAAGGSLVTKATRVLLLAQIGFVPCALAEAPAPSWTGACLLGLAIMLEVQHLRERATA
eukprot:2859654-Amphidinium_carterae.1